MATNQPKALFHLFLTEMWERFSYYGVTAILVLYISHYLQLPDKSVFLIYGAYGAMVYMTSIIGGLLSDRYIGPYYSVLVGGSLIAIGHFILMLPTASLFIFYLGLSVIILGTGLFKPSISVLVGALYQKNDLRRTKGFILAYMGANTGTLIAPITAALIASQYSWHIAFGVAGIGMILGLVNFVMARPAFKIELPRQKSIFKPSLFSVVVLGSVLFLFYHPDWLGIILVAAILLTVLLMAIAAWQSNDKQVRKNMTNIMLLMLFYIGFMALLQISGGPLNLFTDRFVAREFFNYVIPTGFFQSIEPLALITLSFIVFYFGKNIKRNTETNYYRSFAISLLIMGFSFIVLAVGIKLTPAGFNLNYWWLNLTYFLQASGEIFIGPIGLSMLSEKIPSQKMGLFMGAWILASAVANFIAAQIGILTEINYQPSLILSDVKSSYLMMFGSIGGVGLILGILLLCIQYWNKQANFRNSCTRPST